MCSGLVLTALVLHRCGEVDCDKTAVRNGFFFYEVLIREIYSLSEEEAQAKNVVGGVDGVSTIVPLAAVPVTFHANVSLVELLSIRKS